MFIRFPFILFSTSWDLYLQHPANPKVLILLFRFQLFQGFFSVWIKQKLNMKDMKYTYLMVISQIAILAHSHGIHQPICVWAFVSVLISSKLSVTTWTHVFSIVFPRCVRAVSDCHGLFFEIFSHIIIFWRTTLNRFDIILISIFENFDSWFWIWNLNLVKLRRF